MERDSGSFWIQFWRNCWYTLWHDDSSCARENREKIIRSIILGYFVVLIPGVPELWFRWSGDVVTARVDYVRQDSKQR